MTWWHAAQLAVAAVALAQLARAAKVIAWDAPCDPRALLDACGVALAGGQPELARALAGGCRPAWLARLAEAGIEAELEGASETGARDRARAREAMDELAAALVLAEADRLRGLAGLGRIAGPLAFLAIVLELAAAFGPGHGLLALQAGLVQSIAIERAALSLAIGVATTMTCVLAATFLRDRLRALGDELKKGREALLRVREAAPDM